MKNHNFKNPYLPELLFFAIFNFFKRMPVNFMAINYAVAFFSFIFYMHIYCIAKIFGYDLFKIRVNELNVLLLLGICFVFYLYFNTEKLRLIDFHISERKKKNKNVENIIYGISLAYIIFAVIAFKMAWLAS